MPGFLRTTFHLLAVSSLLTASLFPGGNVAAGSATAGFGTANSPATVQDARLWGGESQEANPPPEPSPSADVLARYAAADALHAELLAFSAVREASPAAVLAFAAQASPAMQALLADELAALAQPASLLPQVTASPIAAINSGPCAFTSVQAAIDAAPNGANILVVGQVLSEVIDIASRTITLTGGYNANCTAPVVGARTTFSPSVTGSVMDITSGSVVRLESLVMRNGTGFGAGLDVLGSSQVLLVNTSVERNQGTSGGGMYVGAGSAITLTNNSIVFSNTATSIGGGAMVYGQLAALDTSSDFSTNSAADGGNLAVSGGRVFLNNADVVAGTATNRGGGIYATQGAIITLTTSVFVGENFPCCQTATDGGGIYASNSRIVSLGGNVSILQNQASNQGGGVYLVNSVFSATSGTNLGYDLSPSNGNQATLGGGLYATTSTVIFNGRIINNEASLSGGGLYAVNSVITMTGAQVGGLGANQSNRLGASGLNGAGLYVINQTYAMLSNTSIISNMLTNPTTGYGGGLYVRDGSVVTLTNSQVNRHYAPLFDGRGAGLYVFNAQVWLNNSQVLSNSAQLGGGVRLFRGGWLTVTGGSLFQNNSAYAGVGGAVASNTTTTLTVQGGRWLSNTATTHGGAVALEGSSWATFDGVWEISYNTAGGDGGGVIVYPTSQAKFMATGNAPSALNYNTASGHGGALAQPDSSYALQLYATAGQPLTLAHNQAGGNGGAVFLTGSALADVYGQVSGHHNSAGGWGGFGYLAGGAGLWLDDYNDARPQLYSNQAGQGGAIYAENSPRVECDGADLGRAGAGNTALTGSGGALHVVSSTTTLDNCTLTYNRAMQGNGGAIYALSGTVTLDTDYPALLADPAQGEASRATICNPLTSGPCLLLAHNQAVSSTVSNGNGGAIYAENARLTLTNAVLRHNQAVAGGALFHTGSTGQALLTNALVYSNTSLAPFGAGIRHAGGALTLTHSTLANNVGGAGFSPGAASSFVYNTLIWGNSTAAFGALTHAACNFDQGGTAGPATNPLFVGAGAAENYQLAPLSPALDACPSAGVTHDLRGQPRPLGPAFDMGTYEATVHRLYLPLAQR